jgi:hypothetical protein
MTVEGGKERETVNKVSFQLGDISQSIPFHSENPIMRRKSDCILRYGSPSTFRAARGEWQSEHRNEKKRNVI